MRGESDDGDVLRLFSGFQLSGRLPSVNDRETHIHEHEIGVLVLGHVHPLLPVLRDQDFETFTRQPPRQHIAIHFVVFDEQYFCHEPLPAWEILFLGVLFRFRNIVAIFFRLLNRFPAARECWRTTQTPNLVLSF